LDYVFDVFGVGRLGVCPVVWLMIRWKNVEINLDIS